MRPSHYRRRSGLTPRQREVIKLMAEGRTNGEIGEQLGITLDGAKAHVREIMAKLEATSREDAVQKWRASDGTLTRLGRRMRGLIPATGFAGWGLAGGAALAVGALAVGFVVSVSGPQASAQQAANTPSPSPAATASADPTAGPAPALPVASENPLDVLPGLGMGGVLIYVSEQRSLPNPPRTAEDTAFATIHRTFIYVTFVEPSGQFTESLVAQFEGDELLWAHFERDDFRQEVGESSWMMYEETGWGAQGVQGPYGAPNISGLVTQVADTVVTIRAAEAGGSVVRSPGSAPGLDIISLRMPAPRWGESFVTPFADLPSWVLSQEARDCARYQNSNHGGFRTLELEVPGDGFLPLHATCVATWPTEVEAWSVHREWSALPADAWESVVRQYAPDLAAEAFE